MLECTEEVTANMPELTWQIGSYMYPMTSDQYLLVDTKRSQCAFDDYTWEKPEMVLGTPFMNNYYQVYDVKRNQVGFVPSIYANPSAD